MVKLKKIIAGMLVLLMIFSIIPNIPTLAAETEHETTVVEEPTGKKGIIASYWTDPGTVYYDDPVALGVDHALFNIDMTELVNTDGTGEPFVYNGTTYYYNNIEGKQLYFTFLRMQEIRDKGITLTVQVNMQWSDDPALQELIFPSGRESGHRYYALNTSTPESREILAAAFHYLVTKCPYVNNWIVGCEINSPEQCNYCGTLDVATNVTIAAQTYNLMYEAIQDVNPKAMNYVCLDNIWNFDNGAGIPAKKFLEEFAKLETDKTWHLAFHPYPVPYGSQDDPAEWNMWSEKSGENGYLTHTEYTAFLTGANLEVLSTFIEENYGSEHRIILTEFGFDARAGEEAQAAALYYTYKAAERDDMVDACIYQPWTDTGWDYREMGILDSSGNQRKIYNVFKYMDSNPTLAGEATYLNYLGIDSWTDNIIYEASTNTDVSKAITGVYIPDNDGVTMKAGAIIDTSSNTLTYECVVIDYEYEKWGTNPYPATKKTENKYDNWMEYKPTHPGMYGFLWRAYDENGNIVSEAGGNRYFGTPVDDNIEVDTNVKITGVYIPEPDRKTMRAGAVIDTDAEKGYYECIVIDYDYAKWGTQQYPVVMKTTDTSDNWMEYTPTHPGQYGFIWRAYDENGNILSECGGNQYFEGNTVSNAAIYVPDRDAETLQFGMVFDSPDRENVQITWFLYRPDDGVYESILSDGLVKDNGEWQAWTKKPGRYWIMCRVTAVNNPESSICWGVEVRDGVVIDPE